MAKKTNKSTTTKDPRDSDTDLGPNEKPHVSQSPVLMDEDDDQGEHLPATQGAYSMVTDAASIDRLAHEAGFEVEHVGGSLPLIAFKREGQAFVGRYMGIDTGEGTDREFGLLIFDVLDPARFLKGEDPDACKLVRAQIVNSTALDPFFSKPDTEGQVFRLTYRGEIATKRGLNKLKLITVERFKPRKKGK